MSRHILTVVYGAILTLFGAGLILGFVAGRASAQSGRHGEGHAEMHDLYKNWHPPRNQAASCCNAQTPDKPEGDCRPTTAYLDADGIWQAWNGARWLPVPPDRVLPTDYAGDGRSHLCERGEFIYCFSPTGPKS